MINHVIIHAHQGTPRPSGGFLSLNPVPPYLYATALLWLCNAMAVTLLPLPL